MQHKTKTLIIILMHYLIAIFIGVFLFLRLSIDNIYLNIFISNVIATIYIFIMGLFHKNASLYDPYWSVIPPVILIGFSLYQGVLFQPHILALNIAILIWAIRLTYNWARLWTDFSHQDWRYTMIKEKAPKIFFISNLFGIHLMPTTIVYIQLIGAIYYIQYAQTFHWIAMIGFVIILLAVYIQYKSDQQMFLFKKENKGQVMNQGLWSISRHPNYLGEISVWFGLYLFYLSHVRTLNMMVLSPIAMLMLFVFISIPMMEKRQLKSKPSYATYQIEVSMLIPLPFKSKEPQDVKST